MIENCLKNLNSLINEYYKKIKKDYQKEINKNKFDKLERIHGQKKQQLLEYETSIYKNIEHKKLAFIEILDTKNETPYIFTNLEAQILRHYIGLYDQGKKQPITEISKRFGLPKTKISKILNEIMLYFSTEVFQSIFIEERNEIIRRNLEILKKEILEYDITFLNITDNFIEILRKEKINTVKDILNINYKQIKNMNIEYGYSSKIIIFPKRIIEEIHSLGLEFKNESMIEKLFEKIEDEPINENIDLGQNLETMIDLICARQFEPELLNKLNIKQQLDVDMTINNGYMRKIYNDMLEKIIEQDYENQKQLQCNYTNGKTYYMDKN